MLYIFGLIALHALRFDPQYVTMAGAVVVIGWLVMLPSGGGGWAMPPLVFDRMGTPAKIAAAVLFLASDEASFITGQTLIVDGVLMILDYPSMEILKEVGPGMMSANP